MNPLVELRGVSKRYYRSKTPEIHALRHVNLTVEKGDAYGIIGLSGAGKSTLVRCLSTLEKPSFGEIYFEGVELVGLSTYDLRQMRKKLGLVFQNFNLFSSRTVWGNVAYPLEIAEISGEEKRRRITELLGLVGLTEQKDAYPAQLSGGQKQRVGIARALATEPSLLLLDEATSALDPKTTGEILQLIRYLQKKLDLTVIFITHEMEVVKEICNKVAVLDAGEIIEAGPVAEVFSSPKHPATKKFVQKAPHEIPAHLLSDKGKVVHLHFKGETADQPIITKMVREFHVDANILLGWIDSLQTTTVGNLIVELTGTEIEKAIAFLKNHGVGVEEKIR